MDLKKLLVDIGMNKNEAGELEELIESMNQNELLYLMIFCIGDLVGKKNERERWERRQAKQKIEPPTRGTAEEKDDAEMLQYIGSADALDKLLMLYFARGMQEGKSAETERREAEQV